MGQVKPTADEVAVMREHYPTLGARELIARGLMPGRSVNYVRLAACALRLKVTPETRRRIRCKARRPSPNYMPMPEEIESAAAAIRAKWDDERYRAACR